MQFKELEKISDPANLNSSPWDFIGSDFDGLINPNDAVQDVTQMDKLRMKLVKCLPQADKALPL